MRNILNEEKSVNESHTQVYFLHIETATKKWAILCLAPKNGSDLGLWDGTREQYPLVVSGNTGKVSVGDLQVQGSLDLNRANISTLRVVAQGLGAASEAGVWLNGRPVANVGRSYGYVAIQRADHKVVVRRRPGR